MTPIGSGCQISGTMVGIHWLNLGILVAGQELFTPTMSVGMHLWESCTSQFLSSHDFQANTTASKKSSSLSSSFMLEIQTLTSERCVWIKWEKREGQTKCGPFLYNMLEGDGQYKYLVKYKLTAEHLGREVDEINNSNHNTCVMTLTAIAFQVERRLIFSNSTTLLFYFIASTHSFSC